MSDLLVEAEKPAEEAEKAEPATENVASGNDADALFVMGMRYSTGRDVAHDLVAAHKWLNLAAMMGHEGALAARAELASEMSAAQIAEAQREARNWLWSRREREERKQTSETAAAVVRPLYVRRKAQAMRSAKAFARIAG